MSAADELKKIFLNPRAETLEGVIAVGGLLSPELLEAAYEHGIFPWPHEGYPLLWFCPEERGVLDFADFRMPRSFRKWLNKNQGRYKVAVNTMFEEVLRGCQGQKRKGQSGTWITDEMAENYLELHRSGRALSVEILRDGRLVGGIYGVLSSRYFSCESMFHLEDNVSKLALTELVNCLKARRHNWMDIQMVTSVSASFGGKLISRSDFLSRIGR